MNALRTWMFAGVIALAGGTTAFVALDSTGPTTPTVQTAVGQNQNTPARNNNNAPAASVPAAADELTAADTFQLSFDEIDITADGATAAATVPAAPVAAPQNADVVADGEQLSEEARAYLQEGVDAVTAETLGMSVAELQAARDAGQRMNEILEAVGVTREELQAAVEAAWPSIVQGAEDAGLITAEQADALIENGPRIGRGGGRGRGQGQGGRRNQDGQGDQNRPNRTPPAGQGNNT